MEKFDQILILATVIAVLTEQWKRGITDKWTRQTSIAIGIVLTVIYQQGILAAFGMAPVLPFGEYVDYALTGVLAAFGPNVVFAVVNRKRNPERGTDITEDFKAGGTA